MEIASIKIMLFLIMQMKFGKLIFCQVLTKFSLKHLKRYSLTLRARIVI